VASDRLADFRIRVVRHLLGGGNVVENALVLLKGLHYGFDARIFLRQVTELVLIGDDIRIGEQARYLLETITHGLQLEANGFFHQCAALFVVKIKKTSC